MGSTQLSEEEVKTLIDGISKAVRPIEVYCRSLSGLL